MRSLAYNRTMPLKSTFAQAPESSAATKQYVRFNDNSVAKALQDPAGRDRTVHIRNCAILSMDDEIGDLTGDIVFKSGIILAVGADQPVADDAIIIDGTGFVASPGLVDSHVHAWEGQLRGIAPNGELDDYFRIALQGMPTVYRPHDMYVGNLLTSLSCINAGITTISDASHNPRTPDHANASIEALQDAGIRAVYAAGEPLGGSWGYDWFADVERIQKEYFEQTDQLLQMRIYAAQPTIEKFELARKMNIGTVTEAVSHIDALMPEARQKGLLGPNDAFNHCADLSDHTWAIMRDAGVAVNMTARSDLQFGIGTPFLPIEKAIEFGIVPGLANDVETSYGVDIFNEMRTLFYAQRGRALDPNPGTRSGMGTIPMRDFLKFATVGGALNCGLSHKIGALRPGMAADIILLDMFDINMFPVNNAAGAVVSFAHPGNVDTVFIEGRVKKWQGNLMGLQLEDILAKVDESRNFILRSLGIELNLFSRKTPLRESFDAGDVPLMAAHRAAQEARWNSRDSEKV